ncbi:MAG: amidohydrolase family protein [Coriobacteriia bacterium]|nr:amidohydrolase family protein [Coriobacteriia bacterium]MCL2137077.1 amidohydrolase family protein [Coriobacteriia bacterium]
MLNVNAYAALGGHMLLLARYIVPVSSPHIENGAVLVKDGRIAAVGAAADLLRDYPNEPQTDFGLAVLMPGLVDAHSHWEYSAFRGLIQDVAYADWKIALTEKEERFNDQDWLDSALLGALETVRAGITTVADITSTGASLHAAKAVGLRGIFYREVGTMEKKEVPRILDEAYQEIEDWRSLAVDGFQYIGIAPEALYKCHPQVFNEIRDYAMDGTPVAVHLAGSQEEYDFIRYGSSLFSVHTTEMQRGYGIDMPPWLATGVSPIRYILNWGLFQVPNLLAIHCVHVDEDDIGFLEQYDVAVAICTRCNAQLGMGIAPVPDLVRAGLRIGLGTDSPAASSTTDLFAEMRMTLLIQRAVHLKSDFMTSAQLVRMATLGAAEALGLADHIGSLDVGKDADIIAVSLQYSSQAPTHDPNSAIVHTVGPDNIMMTMVGGNILYNGDHLHGVDRERVLARAEEMRIKLRD